jgi:uncharacterized repeat protein (TIGR03803 family)
MITQSLQHLFCTQQEANGVIQFSKIIILSLALGIHASAAGFKVLHAFGLDGELGGSSLYSSLIQDAAGNLYGTAEDGGYFGAGVVYRLSPQPGGEWTETVLHAFRGGKDDGANPHASLVMDAGGNLYGTTTAGGSGNCSHGCGIVFELSPAASGPSNETVLHVFASGTDGATPYSGVIFDSAGNLYGTTTGGGIYEYGTLYKLTPSGGTWTETILYRFGGVFYGGGPMAAPVFDKAGNLYGTTFEGGEAGARHRL